MKVFRRELGILGICGAHVRSKVGSYDPGVHAMRSHRMAFDDHLLAKCFREASYRELRSAVGALVGNRDQTESTGQVDQPCGALAGPRLDELRQEGLGAVDNTADVDADEPVKIWPGHVRDAGEQIDPGIVEYH